MPGGLPGRSRSGSRSRFRFRRQRTSAARAPLDRTQRICPRNTFDDQELALLVDLVPDARDSIGRLARLAQQLQSRRIIDRILHLDTVP